MHEIQGRETRDIKLTSGSDKETKREALDKRNYEKHVGSKL